MPCGLGAPDESPTWPLVGESELFALFVVREMREPLVECILNDVLLLCGVWCKRADAEKAPMDETLPPREAGWRNVNG